MSAHTRVSHSISTLIAKEISKVARECGAEPGGVFVDDVVNTISRVSDAANLELVQLRGNHSRTTFPVLLQERRVIYILHANEEGELLSRIPAEECSIADWILVDSATGGSGRSKHGWLLAGGIKPENVDVSSGICDAGGINKDQSKISSFMIAVNSTNY